MKLFRALFCRRRWMLWIPILASAALAGFDPGSFHVFLIGGLVFWIPFWLGWWLSDGFSTVRIGRSKSLGPTPGVYYNYADKRLQGGPGPGAFKIGE